MIPKNGIDLIASERDTHISKGYDAAHDALHYDGCMADMAAIYATTHRRTLINGKINLRQIIWGAKPTYPYEKSERSLEDWFTEQPSRIMELVKAGSLIAAEIDRWIILEADLAKEVGNNKFVGYRKEEVKKPIWGAYFYHKNDKELYDIIYEEIGGEKTWIAETDTAEKADFLCQASNSFSAIRDSESVESNLKKKITELESENTDLHEAFQEILLSDAMEDNRNPSDIIAINTLRSCIKWYEDHGKDYGIGTPHCFLNAQYITNYIDGNTE